MAFGMFPLENPMWMAAWPSYALERECGFNVVALNLLHEYKIEW